jgi:hypothetical protein
MSMFVAVNLQSGESVGSLHRHHRTLKFQPGLKQLDEAMPAKGGVPLVLDPDATHKTPPIQRGLGTLPRFSCALRRPADALPTPSAYPAWAGGWRYRRGV